ncbi:octanoyltransferase [Pontibacillus halophilus JSM 076056 = DSM 19796]|uniref:Octanoyl-[GcvH]:protein N-octanoyltransferase n=1 Tax=Pontibacillus halophilus JSM 076056 = DSM 19796 TaxID=1385510 RepID=A0A0A5GRQ3_9BACI|nr:lipoate--protein ligase family protein [Pontibacillus halophilus]KGX93845.1 octanoyltransferase [Pontibacillus halophilus JSM 076056 = DSM 19796]
MKSTNEILKPTQFRFINQSEYGPQFSAMQSFATDDALAISVGEHKSPPTARLWVHHNTIVMGIADAKLPYFNEGVAHLNDQGYRVVVRNSGGLAVVLDEGVMNISLIFPDAKSLDIHDGYEAMVEFTKQLFKEEGKEIEAYEITGSYCPGTYDLSIDGKKFAGISQRRVKNGTAVQIYLCVNGSGSERAKLIRDFYEIGLKGEETRFTYPTIKPNTMASLSELFGKELHMEDVRNRILYLLHGLSGSVMNDPLSDEEMASFDVRYDQMVARNKKALESE